MHCLKVKLFETKEGYIHVIGLAERRNQYNYDCARPSLVHVPCLYSY